MHSVYVARLRDQSHSTCPISAFLFAKGLQPKSHARPRPQRRQGLQGCIWLSFAPKFVAAKRDTVQGKWLAAEHWTALQRLWANEADPWIGRHKSTDFQIGRCWWAGNSSQAERASRPAWISSPRTLPRRAMIWLQSLHCESTAEHSFVLHAWIGTSAGSYMASIGRNWYCTKCVVVGICRSWMRLDLFAQWNFLQGFATECTAQLCLFVWFSAVAINGSGSMNKGNCHVSPSHVLRCYNVIERHVGHVVCMDMGNAPGFRYPCSASWSGLWLFVCSLYEQTGGRQERLVFCTVSSYYCK